MGKRRQSRELALQFLYQYDLLRDSYTQGLELRKAKHLFWSTIENAFEPEVREFAKLLIDGTCESIDRIDQIIERYSAHWKISRISNIDRSILRIAIFELVYLNDIPAPVSINEAIDLGKKFGAEGSGAFINGILDRVRIAREKGEL